MTKRDDCIQKIIETTGGKISRKDAMDMLDELIRRADERVAKGEGQAESIRNAAQELASAVKELSSIEKRNRIDNAIKAADVVRRVDASKNPWEGFKAIIHGINRPGDQTQLSYQARYHGKRNEWLKAGLYRDLEKAGVDDLFISRSLEKEWARELSELWKVDGTPGVTGSKQAKEIAATIHKWQLAAVKALNNEGAWIRKYDGYAFRRTHSEDRLYKAGQEQWVNDVLSDPDFDIPRSLGTEDAGLARVKLKQMWKNLVSGDHHVFDEGALVDVDVHANGGNLAKRVSAGRRLHFKTIDAEFRYNAKYGAYDPTATVIFSFDTMARNYALMSIWGTNPRATFENLLTKYKDGLKGTDEHADLIAKEQALRNRFDHMDGTALKPANRWWANTVRGYTSWRRLADYGLSATAQVPDIAFTARELRYQGVDWWEAYPGPVSLFSRFFKGAKGSDKREIGELLGVGLDSVFGSVAQRFDVQDTPLGMLSRWEAAFFKYNGMTAMNENPRQHAAMIMAAHMGKAEGKAWSAIGADRQRILGMFGINEPEWALLNKAEWNKIDGKTFLTPDIVDRVPREAIEGWQRFRGQINAKSSEAAVTRAVERGYEDLRNRIFAYYGARADYAIPTPGLQEQAIMMQRFAPGTAMWTAARLFSQVKMFTASTITKTWGRELYGNASGLGKVAGFVELIATTSVLGVLSNMANQAAKGQDPTSQFRNATVGEILLAGFNRGGLGSIYGDFLFGETNRFGRGLLATAAGPSFGMLEDIYKLYNKVRRLEDPSASAFDLFKRNMAFQNFIWTKAAVDYLIVWRIQEMLNPGYLRRHEQRLRESQGVEYMLPPSQVIR